jgi:omega-6 fatty acid desaturase (delta-12 desaturase)
MATKNICRPEVAKANKDPLPFTLADVKAVIPKELFKADMATSWYYIARDICAFASTAYAAALLLSLTDNTALRALIWIAHALVQGTTGFGLWVIGHECGHQAYFGDRFHLNNAVGLVIHSFFLVPFHSWRITHATHHRYTNLTSKDTAFVPKDEPGAWWGLGEAFPVLHLGLMSLYLLVGFPVYLMLNYEGQVYEETWNHFTPNAPMFRKQERMDILVSDVGFGAMVAALAFAVSQVGAWNVFLWYGLPYLATNAWLVTVTFLQHVDPRLPHYEDDENFDFLKGALSAIDRTYGGPLDNMMHHITNAHIVHHIFSHMPFYNAVQATPYVKKFVGPKYYLDDQRPLPTQFWGSWFVHQSSFLRSRKWLAAQKK